MHRHNLPQNGYAANKKDDDEAFSQYSSRLDLESKYIWGMQDLIEDEKADAKFPLRFEPTRSALQRRHRLYKLLGLVAVATLLLTLIIFPSTRRFFTLPGDTDSGPEHFDIETLRYYDLEDVQGTSEGWKREERILLCTPLRDAEPHLVMFFSHLRNFTYPHHLIDLAFLVS